MNLAARIVPAPGKCGGCGRQVVWSSMWGHYLPVSAGTETLGRDRSIPCGENGFENHWPKGA